MMQLAPWPGDSSTVTSSCVALTAIAANRARSSVATCAANASTEILSIGNNNASVEGLTFGPNGQLYSGVNYGFHAVLSLNADGTTGNITGQSTFVANQQGGLFLTTGVIMSAAPSGRFLSFRYCSRVNLR